MSQHERDEPPTADPGTAPDTDATRLEFGDSLRLEGTRTEVWETVSDPETLTACVPGAESVERVSERRYTCEITRGISHLTVSMEGEAEFVELEPPDYVVATGTAFDAKTGSEFDVLAGMELTDAPDGVDLSYSAEVSFTGGVAGLGERMLRRIVGRDVDAYFENVRTVVEGGELPDAGEG
jgi:carbon monoxide dehydrogenase subunit G